MGNEIPTPEKAIVGQEIEIETDDAEKIELAKEGIKAARQIHQKLTNEFRSLLSVDFAWGRGELKVSQGLRTEDEEKTYEIIFEDGPSKVNGRECKESRGDIILHRKGHAKNKEGLFPRETLEINEDGSFRESGSVRAPDGRMTNQESYRVSSGVDDRKFRIRYFEDDVKWSPFPIKHTFEEAISRLTDLQEALQKRECLLIVGKPADREDGREVDPKSKKWGPEVKK